MEDREMADMNDCDVCGGFLTENLCENPECPADKDDDIEEQQDAYNRQYDDIDNDSSNYVVYVPDDGRLRSIDNL